MNRATIRRAVRTLSLLGLMGLVAATSVVAQADSFRTLQPGRPTIGRLESGDDTLDSGEYIDFYDLEIDGPGTLAVTVRSEEFDTYLGVFDRARIDEENDDADGMGTNSRIMLELDSGRDLTIAVTSYAPEEVGEYEVLVEFAPRTEDDEESDSTALVLPEVTGTLSIGDRTLSAGEYYDLYYFVGQRNQSVRIDLESEEFDTYLILGPPESAQIDVDDSRGTTNSYLEMLLPEDGLYTVSVTSYAPAETGSYQLRFSSATSGPRQYIGQLSDSDPTLEKGEHFRPYTFVANAGERVVVDLESESFDPYLVIESPSGSWDLQNDDRAEDDFNSRIDTVLEESGLYTVYATSYSGGETGSFRLSIQTEEAGVVVQELATERYVGLFVGISDYPGDDDDLPFCRADAENLSELFITAGLMESWDQMVITDSEATVGGVRAAIMALSATMGENDTLVLFYSGHGETKPSEVERDETDEYLSLYDGALSDDDLAELLSATPGRVQLVFDACYSAGFAKDVLNRAGWFGIFSSEEDVPSYVAEQFEAGGYLSYFFQRAVEGQADGVLDDESDTYISMGELERYLLASWYSDEGPDPASHQHLEFERNGVSLEELLFRAAER